MTTDTGTVVRIIRDRGFLFIRSDTDQVDVFAHLSSFQRSPGFSFDEVTEGARVDFERLDGPRGPRADRITPSVAPPPVSRRRLGLDRVIDSREKAR